MKGGFTLFVFAADLHLAQCAWKSLPQVAGDSYDSFRQIVEFTSKSKASALILGGDIFDAQPTPVDVEVFLQGVMQLHQEKIPVLAIQGQHGRVRELPWTSVGNYVQWLSKGSGDVYSIEKGIKITGFDNMPPEELKTQLKAIPLDVNVLTLHQLCKGTVGDRDGHQAWDLDPSWVPPHVRLILLGDYHAQWSWTNKETGQVFIYSGSTCMQSIDETPEKSFLTVENKGSDFQLTAQPLKTRPFKSFVIKSEEDLKEAMMEASGLKAGTLALVRYDPRILDVESRFEVINKPVHYLFRRLPIELEDISLTEINKLKDISLEGCLTTLVNPREDPSLHSFLISMLRSKNLKETLTTYKSESLLEKSHG
jgi:DNA repair exonuclease SbcCD nuclease subunit